jgi:Tol biopolymer transport system component/DNA-binding winged helix-turn-helix (wHTH) protein
MALWTQSSHRLFRFAAFEVDLWTGEIRKNGAKLKVQNQPLKVLAMLLDRPGELVTREQLREGLWPDHTFVDFERGLNTAVNRLRAALNDSAGNPRFVETVGSRGYRFIAPFSLDGSGQTQSAPEASIPSSHVYIGPSDGRGSLPPEPKALGLPVAQPQVRNVSNRRNYAVAVLILIVVAGGYGVHWSRSHAALPGFESLRLTKLTNSGKAEDVAISPDGSYVVYSQRDQNGVGLWVRHLASGSAVQILPSEDVDFRGLTFSPDGNSVYFVRSRKEIGGYKDLYTIPVLGGQTRLLIRDIDSPVSFSPDGRQFAFTEGFGPPYGNNIRIASTDGNENRVLATVNNTSPNFHTGPAWSPDGRTILISLMLRGERSGYVQEAISPADGRVREVLWYPGAIGRPVWLPDSKAALVEFDDSTGLGQLWTVSLQKGKERRVTNDLANWGLRIDATRDARTVSAIQWSVAAKLWTAPATDLSKMRQVTDGEIPMIAGVVTPEGKILAVSGMDDLWVLNDDGTGLTSFSGLHDVAPPVICGNFVVAASYSSIAAPVLPQGPGTVKAMKLASGRLIVQRSYQSGPVNIVRLDREGLSPTKLAAGFLYSPTCSPDGKFVYYVSMEAPQRILRVLTEGSKPEIVGDVPGQTIRGTMRVSPDGRLLAFPFDQGEPKPVSKLAVVSTQTGQVVITLDAPGGIYRESCLRWSSDGKSLQYLLTRGDVTNIWEQLLSGGPPHQLTKYTSGRIFDFNWSADGKQLLLSRGEVTSDVVLLSNIH